MARVGDEIDGWLLDDVTRALNDLHVYWTVWLRNDKNITRWRRNRNRHLVGEALIIGLHFDLIPRRKERVEAHNQLGMTLEKVGDSLNDARSIDAL